MKKIINMLGKLPSWLLLSIIIIVNIMNGYCVTMANTTEASATKAVTINIIKMMIFIYCGIAATNFIDKVFTKLYKMKTMNNVQSKWLKKTLDSDIAAVQSLSTGKLFDSVKDITILESNIAIYFIWSIPTLIPFITLIYREMCESVIMGSVSIGVLLLTTVMYLISDKLFGFETVAKQKKAALQEVAADNFMNVKTIKFLGVKKFAMERLTNHQKDAFPYLTKPGQILYFRIIDMLGAIPLILNIWLSRGNVELVAFIILSQWTIDNMRGYLSSLAENLVELKAQKEVLKSLKGDDNKVYDKFIGVELNDIYFDYGKTDDDNAIIFNIPYLRINRGDRILVTGTSGEGKSSLANLLAGAIKPSSGFISGNDSVYYVWQETECFADTLRNNIVFDNEYNISDNKIISYFEELDMMNWFCCLKDGLDTQLGERGCKLSSGQKQRINIIRCLIQMEYNPDQLFIMDEITSNLDEATKKLAIKAFDKRIDDNEDISALIISHNDGMEEICERHITVKNHIFME